MQEGAKNGGLRAIPKETERDMNPSSDRHVERSDLEVRGVVQAEPVGLREEGGEAGGMSS